MTQEHKELLFKDLCARLPYGIKCSFGIDDAIYEICGINPTHCGASEIQATHIKSSINGDFIIDRCKPYLIPLLNMTKEQQVDLAKFVANGVYAENIVYDWYNKNHFDYRGLIQLGLALDATNLNIY